MKYYKCSLDITKCTNILWDISRKAAGNLTEKKPETLPQIPQTS